MTAQRASSMSYRLFGGRGEASSTNLTRTRSQSSKVGTPRCEQWLPNLSSSRIETAVGWGRRWSPLAAAPFYGLYGRRGRAYAERLRRKRRPSGKLGGPFLFAIFQC